MRRLHLAVLTLLLSACGGGSPGQTTEPLTLSAVLPSPVTPGDAVVAYGHLPTGTPATLDGQPLTGTGVPGGLQFTLPARILAGLHALRLGPGGTLNGSVQVVPRIDGAEVRAGQLQVWGAGWAEQGVDLEVNGVAAPTKIQGQDLLTTLQRPGVYGALNLRVLVNGVASAPFTLKRSAASVSGTVRLPGSGQALAALALPRRPVTPARRLLVRGNGWTAPLAGLLQQEALPALGVTRLRYASAEDASAALRILVADPAVKRVEPDDVVQLDAEAATQALVPSRDAQWFWPLEGFPAAWAAHLGEGVTVAVVDTGVRLDHPDLRANLWPGLDLVDNDTDPMDTDGHGTHVAGLIAADGTLTGAAPKARLLPVRALSGEDGGSVADVAAGILWAAGLLPDRPNPHPAQVINLSLGTNEYSPELADAVTAAQTKGVLVVAATGNDGGRPLYPAALPGVIAVTALAGPQVPYQPSYANRGQGTALTAYGGDMGADQNHDGVADGILSTDVVQGRPGYALRMGTSMAAPQVSGALALALSSGQPTSLLRADLLHRAADLGVAGLDDTYGWGLLSADLDRATAPRTYVLALRPDGQVAAFTPVVDGAYRLSNVPPGEPLTLLAASDSDDDGVLAEAGDFRSAGQPLTLTASQSASASFTLAPTAGGTSIDLQGAP